MNRRWLIWTIFTVAWTGGLLTPIYLTLPEDSWLLIAKAVATKTLHVLAYAILTVLTGRLEVTGPRRLLLLFFVMAHAGGTEFLQNFVPGRGGSARDVCLDHFGVLLGLACSWPSWRRGLAAP
jgi:hypothetical protein